MLTVSDMGSFPVEERMPLIVLQWFTHWPVYHAFLTLWPKLLLFSGRSYMSNAVPGGAIGVLSKWKSPLVAAKAESLGVCLKDLSIFTARSTCGMRLH